VRSSSSSPPFIAAVFLASASGAIALASAGCGRSCKKDHPYVPYSVDDVRPSALADGGEPQAPLAAPSDAAARASAVEPALVAPPDATTWNVEGLQLVAPAGRELLLAIVRDFDGDGRKDALAIVRSPAPPGKPAEAGAAEILHYAGATSRPQASVVVVAPKPRLDAACVPVTRLERIGSRSALVEVGTVCTRGPSSRALYVVRLAREPAVAFDLALLDPPSAPRLVVDVDGEDRDRDGIDDVTLRLTVEGGSPPFEPGPKLSAKVAFFDRSAGPSRDPDEPEASLDLIAAQATARANKSRDAATVPVLVQQMRMLYRAMCLEGGAPRLVKLPSTPNGAVSGAISCGTSKSLEDAGVAEVRAFVTQGDALRAVAAAEIAQTAPATRSATRTSELAALLAQVAPFVQARSTRTIKITVQEARAAHPSWGALAFEPSGKLLVRGPSQVSRVDPDTGASSDAELPVWASQVLSPDGKSRWLEAYHGCEGVALRATFAPTGADAEMRDVLLPVAPALGSRCAGGRGEAAITVPIAWGPRGLEALVAGQPLLVRPDSSIATIMASPLGEMPPFGSPRSAGGRAMAITTAQGVLVTTTRAARYRAPELEPYAELQQCTTNDDASRLACVKRSGRVVVATFDPL
jgi:hypothetical protein